MKKNKENKENQSTKPTKQSKSNKQIKPNESIEPIKPHKSKKNYTYMVRCRDGSFYTGWTNNLEKRIDAHNAGTGARYTKSRRPVELIYHECFATKEEAMRREWEIKQLNHKQKEKLTGMSV